jgi:Fe-S oxidoreductase
LRKTHADAHRLDTEFCLYCPDLCLFACPVVHGSGLTTCGPMGKVSALHWGKRRRLQRSEDLKLLPYLCADCGLCSEVCAHDQPVSEHLYEARAELVSKRAVPRQASSILPDEEAQREVLKETAKLLSQKQPADLLLFPGCSLLERGPEAVAALVRLLERLGLKGVGVDPDGPTCCGAPWRDLGDKTGYLSRAMRWMKHARAQEGVVVVDPRCQRILEEHLPADVPGHQGAPIVPLGRVLAQAVRTPFPKRLPLRVVLLESCHLARYLGRPKPPLRALSALLEEAPLNFGCQGEESRCCGQSGGLAESAPEIAAEAGRSLLREASMLGGDAVLCLAPACALHLEQARAEDPELPEAIDLAQLIERALELNE